MGNDGESVLRWCNTDLWHESKACWLTSTHSPPVRTRPTLPDSSQVSVPFLLSYFHTEAHSSITGKVGSDNYKIQHALSLSLTHVLPAVSVSLLFPVPLLLVGRVWIVAETLHLMNENKLTVRGGEETTKCGRYLWAVSLSMCSYCMKGWRS